MTYDPLGLLRVLNDHGVSYVVIGGFAAVAYGSPLPTQDVDITPSRTLANLGRLSGALTDLDARVRVDGTPGGLAFRHSAQTLRAVMVLNLTTRLGDLDLVVAPAGGASYEELAERGRTIDLGDVLVPLASLDDVIASKEAAGRPKDRAALPLLRVLQDRLGPAPSTR